VILGSIVAVAVVTAVVGARAQQAPPFAPVAKIQKVRDNLYYIFGMGGNTTVFVTANGVVLVDTKLANNGQAILDQIKSVTNKPIVTIINTHTHADHTGSNDTFPASVDIIAQDNTKTNMAKLDPPVKPVGMPDHTFKDKMSLNSGADRVDLYYFGRGHTNGDAVVVFPAVRAAAVGDLFAWKQPPYVDSMNGGSVVDLPATLEKLSKGIGNVETIITGHMEPLQKMSDVVEYAQFNRDFLTAVQAAKKAGRTADQAAAELKLPAKWNSYLTGSVAGVSDAVIGTAKQRSDNNVKAAYAELK
jgi:glyoxylase-like metal-dependent hydrolase (beta-lactamase superfamily II)